MRHMLSASEKEHCTEPAQGSQWPWALGLLAQMREPAAEPGTITYNASISACEKGSQWPGALSLLARMRELAAEPDTVARDARISAWEKRSQWPGG